MSVIALDDLELAFKKKLETIRETASPQPALFEKNRQKAWQQFVSLPLPTAKEEKWKNIRLKNIYNLDVAKSQQSFIGKQEIEPYVLEECKQSYLVFVDGSFEPSLSCYEALKDLVIGNSHLSWKMFGPYLTSRFQQHLTDQDPFVSLNYGWAENPLVIFIPQMVQLKTPIQILEMGTSNYKRPSCPRIHVIASSGSYAKLLYTPVAKEQENFAVELFDFSLENHAHVDFGMDYTQACSSKILSYVKASLSNEAKFNKIFVNLGTALFFQDVQVDLIQEGSEASMKGVSLLKNNLTSHVFAHVNHKAPNTVSNQQYKNVLFDRAVSSFQGKIFVEDVAQKTQAYQLNQNLLMSHHAIADSKPGLEIFADDVKASHGATFGALDQEQVFYLMSRGLSNKQAQELLIHGFVKEIAQQLPLTSLYDQAQMRILNAE